MLVEFIESSPAMRVNCDSNGVATVTATAKYHGASARKIRGDDDGWKIDVRERVDGKREVAEQARKQKRRHDQDGHHRASDEDLRNVHDACHPIGNGSGKRRGNSAMDLSRTVHFPLAGRSLP